MVIVDQEDPERAIEYVSRESPGRPRANRRRRGTPAGATVGMLIGDGALSLAGATRGELAAVLLEDRATDRQAQA